MEKLDKCTVGVLGVVIGDIVVATVAFNVDVCGAVVLEFDWLSVNEVVIHDIFELSVCFTLFTVVDSDWIDFFAVGEAAVCEFVDVCVDMMENNLRG